jgi:hypothetical protein
MPMRRAWARTRIHLGLGEFGAAVAAAREASAITEWERFGSRTKLSHAGIYSSPEMPIGWVWFEPAQWRVLISDAVLREHGFNNALYEFTDVVLRLKESTFRAYSGDTWHELDALDDIVRAFDSDEDPI